MGSTAVSLVSIVVPLHNEALSLPHLYKAVVTIASQISDHVFEFIFVDDGSTDSTVDLTEQLMQKDKRIHLIELSRNFGKEAAVASGLAHARGHAAIIMDADLQHPPELIPEFLLRWQQGFDVVVGVREYSAAESYFKRFMSALFYRLIGMISHTKIVPHATDFRLLDRKVIDTFNGMTERNRMNRGLIDWLGYKRDYVHFVAGLRRHGEASYSIGKLYNLAMNSFTAYSLFPLRLAGYLGVLILVLATPLNIFSYTERFVFHDPFDMRISGTALLAMAVLLLVGLVLACLGLISMYIGHIHAEVTNRPLYVVRRSVFQQETEGDSA